MNQSRLGIALLVIFQIAFLLISNNNQIFALQSHNQKRISFQTTITPQPLPQTNNTSSNIKKFTLIADENILKVSADNALHPGGILYNAMTFNGTIPGPIIAVTQGDTFQITLQNKGELVHSLDLHGVEGPSHAYTASVNPGENKTLEVKAENAGVFMYHCDGDNLNGIWDHIASGMYGGIVVHPKNEKPAKEFYMVVGETYNTEDRGLFVGASNSANATSANATSATTTTAAALTKEKSAVAVENQEKIGSFDMNKFIANKPDLILTNGMAYKYMPLFGSIAKIILNKDAEMFKVKPGQLTRWYIVNAGPRGSLSLNFASTMISSVLYGSNNNNQQTTIATTHTTTDSYLSPTTSKIYEVSIPPGSAEAVEVVFPEAGTYVRNDHDIGRFVEGAGFVVVATSNSTSHDHPKGTWVQPYTHNDASLP
jgi:nitrite reductase (NO-forming)